MLANRKQVAIVGIGEVPPARHLPGTTSELALIAIERAVQDAGLTAGDIDGIVGEGTSGSLQVLPDVIATLGLSPDTFTAQGGGAGVGLVGSPLLAQLAIDAGLATTVVCFYAAQFGSESQSVYEYHAKIPVKAEFEIPHGMFPQPAYMAAMANRYLYEHGYQPDDLAQVTLSQREWAAKHPEAIKGELLSLDDYHTKPIIAAPLRNVDCSLMNDGAIAFVMTSVERARDLRQRPVRVAGSWRVNEPIGEHSHLAVREDFLSLPSRFSGPKALELAQISVKDIDLFEIYDCFSIIPVLQLEDLGVFERGEALAHYRKGEMRPGGSMPVNTHGGLLAHSYLIGGNHMVEAVRQLRGAAGDRQVAGAGTALVTGWSSQEHATTILRAN